MTSISRTSPSSTSSASALRDVGASASNLAE